MKPNESPTIKETHNTSATELYKNGLSYPQSPNLLGLYFTAIQQVDDKKPSKISITQADFLLTKKVGEKKKKKKKKKGGGVWASTRFLFNVAYYYHHKF